MGGGFRDSFRFAKNQDGINFNSWQAGLERMMLGYAMREEHGIWQDSLGLNSSYGLKGEFAGNLSHFFFLTFRAA